MNHVPQQKQNIVHEVSSLAEHSNSLFIASFSGMTSNNMNELRKTIRESGMVVRVVKNTLAKIGFNNTKFSFVTDSIKYNSILLLSQKLEASEAAKILYDIVKINPQFQIKYIALEGNLYGEEMLEKLSLMPTKEQALVSVVQTCYAPMYSLVNTLLQAPQALVQGLNALSHIKSQKQDQHE